MDLFIFLSFKKALPKQKKLKQCNRVCPQNGGQRWMLTEPSSRLLHSILCLRSSRNLRSISLGRKVMVNHSSLSVWSAIRPCLARSFLPFTLLLKQLRNISGCFFQSQELLNNIILTEVNILALFLNVLQLFACFWYSMTRVELKDYLEKIYNVPVAAVRTRIQFGKSSTEEQWLFTIDKLSFIYFMFSKSLLFKEAIAAYWLLQFIFLCKIVNSDMNWNLSFLCF